MTDSSTRATRREARELYEEITALPSNLSVCGIWVSGLVPVRVRR